MTRSVGRAAGRLGRPRPIRCQSPGRSFRTRRQPFGYGNGGWRWCRVRSRVCRRLEKRGCGHRRCCGLRCGLRVACAGRDYSAAGGFQKSAGSCVAAGGRYWWRWLGFDLSNLLDVCWRPTSRVCSPVGVYLTRVGEFGLQRTREKPQDARRRTGLRATSLRKLPRSLSENVWRVSATVS